MCHHACCLLCIRSENPRHDRRPADSPYANVFSSFVKSQREIPILRIIAVLFLAVGALNGLVVFSGSTSSARTGRDGFCLTSPPNERCVPHCAHHHHHHQHCHLPHLVTHGGENTTIPLLLRKSRLVSFEQETNCSYNGRRQDGHKEKSCGENHALSTSVVINDHVLHTTLA